MNSKKHKKDRGLDNSICDNRMSRQQGVVLMLTLVILVVLSTLAYTVTSRIMVQRNRNRYIIDYSMANYGCASGLKYALSTLELFDPNLIDRPNEPDFSDLFALNETEYQELLVQASKINQLNNQTDPALADFAGETEEANLIQDVNSSNGTSDTDNAEIIPGTVIRGPYGPVWPYAIESIEFEVGSAKVRIEIEDENAKYPLGWMLMDDEEIKREVVASFETFCEWMALPSEDIELIKEQCELMAAIKPFHIEFKPITTIERRSLGASTRVRSRAASARSNRTRVFRKTVTVAEQVNTQNTDFARLFHSNILDTELLGKPTIQSQSREESALKYIGLWATRQVNINTAPRHVLEAAFTFGGDADKIANEIILRRWVRPFADIDDLKKSLFKYVGAIDKCQKYITTRSTLFTIRVTAVCGVAEVCSVAAIAREGNKVKTIAFISG